MGAQIDTSIAIKLIACDDNKQSATACFDTENPLKFVLAGGDDYELAFTAPASARQAVAAASRQSQTPVTRIGQIDKELGLRLIDAQGQALAGEFSSFDHFA